MFTDASQMPAPGAECLLLHKYLLYLLVYAFPQLEDMDLETVMLYISPSLGSTLSVFQGMSAGKVTLPIVLQASS